MLSALPIRIRNDDLVTITEVTNSISSVDQVISELDFEKQICYALSKMFCLSIYQPIWKAKIHHYLSSEIRKDSMV